MFIIKCIIHFLSFRREGGTYYDIQSKETYEIASSYEELDPTRPGSRWRYNLPEGRPDVYLVIDNTGVQGEQNCDDFDELPHTIPCMFRKWHICNMLYHTIYIPVIYNLFNG